MTYYDAALPEIQAQYHDVLAHASSHFWPHPLVVVDDKIVMAGDVDAYRLSGLIQQALQSEPS